MDDHQMDQTEDGNKVYYQVAGVEFYSIHPEYSDGWYIDYL